MKDNQDNQFKIELEGEIKESVESQDSAPLNTDNTKSEGNTPSDLGAIKKNQLPSSAGNQNTRSNLTTPNSGSAPISSGSNTSSGNNGNRPRQVNRGMGRKNANGKKPLKKPGELNPTLNSNKMKDFGKANKPVNPNLNPSSSFLTKAKGMFNGKGGIPHLPGLSKLSSFSKRKETSGGVDKLIQKKTGMDFITLFKALPIQVKVAIVGGGLGLFLLLIVLIIVIITNTSAADGNREMKEDYIQGNYTEAQLCEYLERNGYLNIEEENNIKCEDSPAYQFFVNFKDLMEEYEEKYSQYRFKVNVELLYETLAYYSSDDEMYQKVTKEEIQKLIDAMLEEVEESCVVKTYDEDKKVCTEKKYVYTLYEFSLNKYVSYLKYGTTSTHPNYGNDKNNTSSNGKSVERICGEGKNVDYVFGYGLVNTSSSPLAESSDCPNNPVTEKDYKDLPATKTTLEKLGAYGSVPYFENRYDKSSNLEMTDNGTASSETTKNVVISPSHQVSNMYSGKTLSEKTSMYFLASHLKSELESRGYNVFVVPENDGTSKYSSNHTQSGVDWLKDSTGIYIALHSNATGSSSLAWGPLALYDPSSSNSKNFVSKICSNMKQLYTAEGRKMTVACEEDTGNRSEVKNFYSLGGKGAAALVEVGFHDNQNEAVWITKNYSKIAASLANAIDQYIGK